MSKLTFLAASALLFGLGACSAEDGSEAPLSGAARGEKLFTQCGICHSPADPATPAGQIRLAGPNLFGIVGRRSAAVEGFSYSPPMRRAGLVWDEETLDRFIDAPQAVVPGTRMSFAGEHDPEARRAIIDYLKTLKPSPTDQSRD